MLEIYLGLLVSGSETSSFGFHIIEIVSGLRSKSGWTTQKEGIDQIC